MEPGGKAANADILRTIRHDIKNQLSNISLLLEQLRYDIPDAQGDPIDCIEMISASIKKIDAILKTTE